MKTTGVSCTPKLGLLGHPSVHNVCVGRLLDWRACFLLSDLLRKNKHKFFSYSSLSTIHFLHSDKADYIYLDYFFNVTIVWCI